MERTSIKPDTEKIEELLEKLADHATEMGELQEELAEAFECFVDESDEFLAEVDLCLDDAVEKRETNELLFLELNASRKELCRLIGILQENGISLPDGSHIHYGRLNPDLYRQGPDGPFYTENPDDHYKDLLRHQYYKLHDYENRVPMTTVERRALYEHLIQRAGLEGGDQEWTAFLEGFRVSATLSGKK